MDNPESAPESKYSDLIYAISTCSEDALRVELARTFYREAFSMVDKPSSQERGEFYREVAGRAFFLADAFLEEAARRQKNGWK